MIALDVSPKLHILPWYYKKFFFLHKFFQIFTIKSERYKDNNHKCALFCRSLILNSVGMVTFPLLCVMVGLTIYAYYAHVGCDPVRAGYVASPNQVSLYIMYCRRLINRGVLSCIIFTIVQTQLSLDF